MNIHNGGNDEETYEGQAATAGEGHSHTQKPQPPEAAIKEGPMDRDTRGDP